MKHKRKSAKSKKVKNKEYINMKRAEIRILGVNKEIEKMKNSLKEKRRKFMQNKRQEKSYKEKEKLNNLKIMTILRQKEEYREKEKNRNRQVLSQLRTEKKYRIKEKVRDAKLKRKLRQQEEYRKKERENNKDYMSQLRKQEEYRKKERENNKELMSQLRKQEEYRIKEKERDAELKRELRQKEEYRNNEKEKDAKIKRKLRQQEEYRNKENVRNKTKIKQLREQEKFRKKERMKDLQMKRTLREDEVFRSKEREDERKSKMRKRHLDLIRFRELVYNNLLRSDTTFSRKQLNFIQERKSTPSLVCCSCEGLFFKHSVVKFDRGHFKQKDSSKCFVKIYNIDSEYICKTCNKYVNKGRVPKLATSNGLQFVNVPECVRILSPLEERMVSPYINFMQIRELKLFALNPQLGLKGSVVNIPIEINDVLQVLPRSFDNMSTIQVKLKRHMLHATDYMFETIRPAVVCDALKYLKETPLYKKYDIVIDNVYFQRYEGKYEEKMDFVIEESDMCDEKNCETKDKDQPLFVSESHEDMMLDDINFDDVEFDEEVLVMDRNFQFDENIKVTAPGQGKKPVPWHMVDDLDELTFPTIFGGHAFDIPPEVKITYSDRAKSECRRKDRRSCTPTRLLYMAKKKLEKSCLANINVCLRKTKSTEGVCASLATNPEFISDLIKFDAGYSILNKIRSSPSFWESKKRELLAMIRQLGKPTFFLTLSSGEKIWPELIKTLFKFSHDKNISDEEAYMLSESEKSILIRNDPVTCARYFDYKISKFMLLIKEENSFFGNYLVEDSYSRVEFQMRGSPHEHIFLWLKDAPSYEVDNCSTVEQCVDFVDNFITCEYDPNNPLIALQRHRHSHSCHKGKKNKEKCRFNFPIPVIPRTMILEPLDDDAKTDDLKESLKEIRKITNYLYKKPQDISFDEILKRLNMTEDKYIHSIRSSLKRTQVFLKRSSFEVGINCYNKLMLNLFESNMDIQVVLDEYGLASYVLNYISKVDAGLSKLLRDAASDVKGGNKSIKDKFRNIANVFLNSNLMSSQEAAYHVLSLPLSKMSRQCVFINTSPIKERVLMLKSKKHLQNLAGDSTEIFMKDNLRKYSERPSKIENICLADFCSLYTKNIKDPEQNEDKDDSEECENLNKRKKNAIIRYRRYKLDQDPANYYREQILLFLPWRNEKNDVENLNYKIKYYQNRELIEENRKKYSVIGDEALESAMKNIENEKHYSDEEKEDIGEEMHDICREQQIDILDQAGMADDKNKPSRYVCPKRISENEMCALIQQLNREQLFFVLYVLKWIKTKDTPLKIFLSGSAGVGKSTVIKCLFQAITNYFDNMPGGNKGKIVVLLCAPSGKAAFLIKGVTLHTAFALPVTQFGGQMPELAQDLANTIREKLSEIKLIIIDEISMVGSTLFNRVDTRLRQVKGVNSPFGGVSIICVGDLHQLPPVMDTAVFKSTKVTEMNEFFDSNPLWDDFNFYELTTIMRQKNDINFITALNHLAIGKMTEDDILLLKSREVTEEQVPHDAVRLFSENIEVDAFNNKKIDSFPGEEQISEAKDNVLGKVSEKTRNTILNSLLTKKTSEVNGLPHRLRLKIGIRYMISSNIDVEDGLVNGACGTLRRITFKPNSQEPRQLWLDFDSEDVGKKARMPFAEQMKCEGIDSHLTPILKSSHVLNISNKLNFQVTRQQFPLTPAEAVTIHKSQGQTCSKICVDFKKMKRITRPMLYVALSRVTSLSGLFILGTFKSPKHNTQHDPILEELNRLRTQKEIVKFSDFECTSSGLKIAYLNIGSLQKNISNITQDEWYQNADLLIFTETLTVPVVPVQIPNFVEILRSDRFGKSRGLLAVSKSKDFIVEQHIIDTTEMDSHLELVLFKFGKATIISGYKSPKFPNSKLKSNLKNIFTTVFGSDESNMVLIGDFNIDLMKANNSDFIMFLQSYGLETRLPPDIQTTNLKTQIDVIFTNSSTAKTGTRETYFSYHKCIYVILNECHNSPLYKEAIEKKTLLIDNNSPIEELDNICKNNKIRNLTENEKRILLDPRGYLEDSHVDLFGEILNVQTNFNMQSVLYLQIPHLIKPIKQGIPNLQILYSSCPGSNIGHWICTYHDGNINNIYDSLNSNTLENDHRTYLNRLYGHTTPNRFHDVQNQLNPYDCGLFAIAFAVSICLGRNPVNEKYNPDRMRIHAAEIFNSRSLMPFPVFP